MQIIQKPPHWVEYHHCGLRKYLIAVTECYIFSCQPPAEPTSSCSISPDNETSVKAIGQLSKKRFSGNMSDRQE